jgi:hypothetical protein
MILYFCYIYLPPHKQVWVPLACEGKIFTTNVQDIHLRFWAVVLISFWWQYGSIVLEEKTLGVDIKDNFLDLLYSNLIRVFTMDSLKKKEKNNRI